MTPPPRRRPPQEGPAPACAECWTDVVRRVREGDGAALANLTGLVTGLLARQGAYRVRESWEDICQEVLALLIRSVEEGTLREPRAFVRYAATLTRNRYVDFIQRRERITSGGRRDEVAVREPLDSADGLATPSASQDVLLDLERALASLSPRGRRVIEEIYLHGRTYEEASEVLGLPLGTLKRSQTAGLRSLRDALCVAADTSPAEIPAAQRSPDPEPCRREGRDR